MFQGKLLVFSAPSGSGKTTLIQSLLRAKNLPIEFSVSATSRPARGNEKEGKAYYFLSKTDFQNKIKAGNFLEWQEVYEGCFYGTLQSEIARIWKKNKHVVLDMDVLGGLRIKALYPERTLATFIQAPSLKTMATRLKNRNTDSEAVIEKRIKKAHYEIQFAPEFDKILVNDNLEQAKKRYCKSGT